MRSIARGTRRKRALWIVATIALVLACSMTLRASYLRNVPVVVKQPDGEVLTLLATGDEFYHWVHDENNFTIVRNPDTGYAEYALLKNGELVPSGYRVGKVDPPSVGLQPGINIPPARIQAFAERFPGPSPAHPELIQPAPKTGTINNLVVFIRFSDEVEFTDATTLYDSAFNTSVVSMHNYFHEVSYDALSISSTFYPVPGVTIVSYQDAQPRGYYQPYDATTNPIGYTGGDSGTMRRNREHTLLANAVNAISTSVPMGLNLDGDDDGRVDNVCFVVYGGPDAWGNLLWPHMWSLYSQTVYINSKRVYTYNFQLQSAFGVSVLCHEMFHSLGAPDLYHYSYDGLSPVGPWDLMEWNLDPPQHMTAYMKYRYGTWIASIPEITVPGTYTLSPLTSATNNCFRIPSNSGAEYFVAEYRRTASSSFESSLPGTGLIVYRINTTQDGQGNESGPPDEVYVYRPGGTPTADGDVDNAYFSSSVGRTAINDMTNPSSFLSDGSAGGLDMSDVSAGNGTISFRVCFRPSLPTGVSATDGTYSNSVWVTWSAASGATRYEVHRATEACGAYAKIGDATGTAFDDTGATPLQVYWYKVNACNACGCSDLSTADSGYAGSPSGGTSAVFRVGRATGDVHTEGAYYGQCYYSGSADVAEWVPVSEPVEPGDVLELDPAHPGQYRKSSGVCSALVAGVVSESPGIILGGDLPAEARALLALVGIVPVKVTDEGGPIQPGDLVVVSSRAGFGMRWDPTHAGSTCGIVGKALEAHEKGDGVILVLLTAH